MKYSKDSGCGCGSFIVGHLILGFLLSWWTDGNLEWMLTQFKDAPVVVPFWISMLISILLGEAILIFNIIIELLKLVM